EEFLNLLDKKKECKSGMETLLFFKIQKKEILDSIHKKVKFKEKTLNFILSLLDANRMAILPGVITLLEELWFEKKGIERLKVYSAIALSSGLEKKLKAKLEESFNKKIVIDAEIDPSLIAGLKIQRGSIYYDFSVDGNLKKLKEALLMDAEIAETKGSGTAASAGER
ncbi:MAG: ATP synthase F1 subunit delta, partial [bacterium]|nr:ATP synthase F1 subunit delta [bacterium]